jgi:hypothetical protein
MIGEAFSGSQTVTLTAEGSGPVSPGLTTSQVSVNAGRPYGTVDELSFLFGRETENIPLCRSRECGTAVYLNRNGTVTYRRVYIGPPIPPGGRGTVQVPISYAAVHSHFTSRLLSVADLQHLENFIDNHVSAILAPDGSIWIYNDYRAGAPYPYSDFVWEYMAYPKGTIRR